MSQRLVNGILVLNTMADILGNSSESSFHGESNGILSIGVLLPYHEKYGVNIGGLLDGPIHQQSPT